MADDQVPNNNILVPNKPDNLNTGDAINRSGRGIPTDEAPPANTEQSPEDIMIANSKQEDLNMEERKAMNTN